ncbi:hypothetical protein ACFW2V_13705 [Streptomyces sp. NPDC058947]|uniref:hypothetical protein n=1 Tax=Streptomyces sp. NPDC058947 TaxID=3346675 RepID=UPI0036C75A73
MPNQIQTLKAELERTLEVLRRFQEFTGAVNYNGLKILVENKPEGATVSVAVRDCTGHFYRGRIEGIRPGGGSFEVLADDGELVPGVTAEQIIAVRIQDKK